MCGKNVGLGNKFNIKFKSVEKIFYIYLIIFLLTFIVVSQQKVQGLFMDDLVTWGSWQDEGQNLWRYMWQTSAFKIRPITYFVMGVGFLLVGPHTEYLWIWMFLINFSVALIVFHLFDMVIKDKWLALLGTITFLVSRFAYYAVGQYFGIMEQISTIIALLVLRFVLKMISDQNPHKSIVKATVLAFFIVFAHERYLSLLIVVMLGVLLLSIPWRKKLIYVGAAFGCLCFALIVRGIMFGDNAWAGTGGTNMISGLDIKQIFTFIFHGILYLLGVNVGPSYLSGYVYDEVPGIIYALNIIIWIIIILFFIRCFRKRTCNNWKRYFIIIVFIGATLLVSCTTIRLELRWLYTPFAGVILLWLMLMKDGELKNRFKRVLPTVMLLCMVVVEIFFHTGFWKIYFWNSQNVYNQIYELTWVENNFYLEGKEIVVISESTEHLSQNDLQTFFDRYAAEHEQIPPSVTTYKNLYEFEYSGREHIILLITKANKKSKVSDVTDELRDMAEALTPAGVSIREAEQLEGFYGWQGENNDYIWMGRSASMTISTGETGEATLVAKTPDFNVPNVLKIYFNEELVCSYNINSEKVEICFTLPSQAEGVLRLEMDMTYSPYEAGKGEDRRQLGLCINELKVN